MGPVPKQTNYAKLTSGVSVHNGLGIRITEVKPVSEEQRPDKGQLLEVVEGYRRLQQLPVSLQREELVDELARVCEEVVIVVLISGIIELEFMKRMNLRRVGWRHKQDILRVKPIG